MKRSSRSGATTAFFVTACLSLSVIAPERAAEAAPTKTECIEAFDKGQRLRREGALRQAREALLVCSMTECPSIVRADCAGVLRQVDAAQASIVLKAADKTGNDLTDVTVELEGHPLTTTLDGRAIPVDPGKLVLVFKRPPWDPVTVQVVIAEGEKGRIVHAALGPEPPAKLAPPTLTIGPPPPPPPPRSLPGWIIPGSLAVVGLGAFAFAGITRVGLGDDAAELKTRCGPNCPQAERDRLSDDLTLTNVMLGVGIGSLVLAAAAWIVFAPKGSNGFARARGPGVVW